MPASVDWDDASQTTVRQQLVGDWTFDEYLSSGKKTQELTSSVSHTVHVIVDFTRSTSYDTKVLAAAQSFDHNFPDNQGCLVLVQCPAYIRAVFDIATRLYPRIGENAEYVDSLADAYAFIYAQDHEGVPQDS